MANQALANSHWQQLIARLTADGMRVVVTWSDQSNNSGCKRLRKWGAMVYVQPPVTLTQMASILYGAKAAVAVDTGFGHLAAAMNIPTVALYGPTDPQRIGCIDKMYNTLSNFSLSSLCKALLPVSTKIIHPPCMQAIQPQQVWDALK